MEAKKENKCGAKTRGGTACRRAPMRNGRCHLHGGKSLAYFMHPNYKHGRYSKYSGIAKRERAERHYNKLLAKRRRAVEEAIEIIVLQKGREPTFIEILAIFAKTEKIMLTPIKKK